MNNTLPLAPNWHPICPVSAALTSPPPSTPGVYAFWWIGTRNRLMSANRNIVLTGPGGQPVNVLFDDWWPNSLPFPCLYVGKSTNLRKRLTQHIMPRKNEQLHPADPGGQKAKPYTTSCQLRWGIEHIFPTVAAPLTIILNEVGFSYRTSFADQAIVERFYEEDRLIGEWRPWFNIDSER